MKQYKKVVLQKQLLYFTSIFALLFLISHGYAAVVISGKQGTLEQPFPFTVQATAYNPSTATLFIGAHELITNEEDKSQAISVVGGNMLAVIGITPEKISFNNSADQVNPLYGKKINFLALPLTAESTDLFVVTADQNTHVSFIRNATDEKNRAVYQTSPLLAGSNLATNGIVGLTALPGRKKQITENLGVIGEDRFFAAVRPNVGTFGLVGSGIAVGFLEIRDEGDKTKGKETVDVKYYLVQDVAFLPLDVTSSALKIGADLVSIDNDTLNMPVVMESSSKNMNTFFTGLFVTGGPDVDDGARAVTVNGNAAIAPASAIEANSIIGGIGADIQVSIHFLKKLLTSTRLDYLIVVGGVGSPVATAQSVYSLPLTKSGYLAKKNAVPVSSYEPTLNLLMGRDFPDTEAAQFPGELFSPDALDIYKARVGGNATLPGPITAVFAEKDAVFVTVGTHSATEMAGVFCSEMIFDNLGRQQGWTDWRRAVGTTDTIFGLAFNPLNGTFWYFPGTDANSLTLLYKTLFSTNKLSPFEQAVQDAFSAPELKNQGVQGLFDFDKNNVAFEQDPLSGARISVLCATGYQKVVLFQNGADVGTLFAPTSAITTSFESMNNVLAGLVSPVQQISMTGSVLEGIGPIIAADIISDGTFSWLVVGGSHGVAVLANPDGSGWTQGQLQKGFVNVPATLTWHALGNFQQVRKIIADNGLLYILTASNVTRIKASSQIFLNSELVQGTEVASVKLLEDFVENGTFSDLAVSGKFALLATSVGLFRVGNGQDISQAHNENLINWTKVVIPEGSGPVTRLFVIAPTSDSTTFATDERGGLVYVLQATVSLDTAKIARFSVQGLVNNAPVTDATLQGVGDLFVNGRPSIYANIGLYRNYVVTDGAALFVMRSAYFPRKQLPFFQIVNPVIRTGVRLELVTEGLGVFVEGAYRIGPMIKRSVDGSWMIAGNTLMTGE